MADDRWNQIEQLLEETLARPPGERAAFLEAACDDPALREEVAALAAAYDEADGLFDGVAGAVVGPALDEWQEAGEDASRPASDPLALEGTQVRRYAVEEHLGGGGMGVVYRARDTRLGRDVALKLLPPHLSASAEAKARFIREAKAASALDHPNIATVYEIGETEAEVGTVSPGQLFIAMAYYAGETLKEKIAREGPLPVDEAASYAIQIAEGLCKAHAAGIVHRDVKPANVIVTEEGTAKLVDFGLARAAGESALTRAGQVLGTAAYMSPEQARGGTIDARTDLWALGAVLYEMLTGRRPFRGQRPEVVIYAILNEEPDPLTEARPEVPTAQAAVVEGCLAKDPAKRYTSAEALLADLRAVRTNADVVDVPYSRLIGLHFPPRRWILGAAAVLLALAIAVGWALWPGGPAAIDSIAVLPLKDLSGDPNQAYFADGMTEALTTELGQISALKVISRTSAMHYKRTDKRLPEIARELDVDALIEGSVLRAGDQVRINLQLVHGSTDRHLWSKSYERELRDVLALQGEVARAIAGEIKVTVASGEQARLARAPVVDPRAYRNYVRGNLELVIRGGESEFRRAIEHYERAIAIDSTFARAHAALAIAHLERGWWLSLPVGATETQARAAASRAMELDSTLAEAHIAFGRIKHLIEWDWAGAERAFQRGLALNPSSTNALLIYHNYLMAMGRAEEATRIGRRAVEIDPLSAEPHAELGWALGALGRHAEARQQYHKALELAPDFPNIHLLLAGHYGNSGQFDEARRHASKAERLLAGASTPLDLGRLGRIYASIHRRAAALRILNELETRSKTEYVPPTALALIHIGLGENEKALELLEQGYDQRDVLLVWLKGGFAPLRDDPRFQALLEQMNFPPSQGAKEESAERRADPPSRRNGDGVRKASTAPSLSGPSVVVLPLENLSGDPDQAYFADGMTGAIIANLTRIEALHVISRTTAMHYKGADAPLRAIASRLGVQYVVDGAVFATADSVRITASLVEAAADRTVWTRTFTREMRGVLGLQRAVARAVAEGIEVELSPETEARMAQAPEVDPAAYRRYQRGVQIRKEQARIGRAREYFERAVAIDSSFALAWAWMAKMHAISGTTRTPAEDLKAKAEEAVEKALVPATSSVLSRFAHRHFCT